MLHLGIQQNSPFLRQVSQVPLYSVKKCHKSVLQCSPPTVCNRQDFMHIPFPRGLQVVRVCVKSDRAGHN